MPNDTTALLRTDNGEVHRMGPGSRVLLGFDGAWLALSALQIRDLGNTLGNILACPFRDRHLEAGMLLRSPERDYRMPLTVSKAVELHALLNDTLLLLDAERSASTCASGMREGC